MNFSCTSQFNLCTVISIVPPPQSSTITTEPLPIYALKDGSASSRHCMDAPSGSKHSNKFDALVFSTIPASTAAFLMKYLCSSLHKAGTVMTHLILAGINFPNYSFNLFAACCDTNLRVWDIKTKRGISLPSTDLACESRWRRFIL